MARLGDVGDVMAEESTLSLRLGRWAGILQEDRDEGRA